MSTKSATGEEGGFCQTGRGFVCGGGVDAALFEQGLDHSGIVQFRGLGACPGSRS